jgi:hypothetical protein
MTGSIKLLPLLCLPGMTGLLGCAGEPLDTAELDTSLQEPAEDPTAMTSAVIGERSAEDQAHLDQLAALEVFTVGNMLARYPMGALNCYGVCPQFEAEIAQANVQASERLAALAEHSAAAIQANATVDPGVCEPEAIEANLAALRALEVVEVGEFLALVPNNNPNCYNVPCPEDEAAAQQGTCERAATLARIVDGL